jgi:hypothetical protein
LPWNNVDDIVIPAFRIIQGEGDAFAKENRVVDLCIGGGLIVVLIWAGGLEVVHGFERAFDDVPAGDDGSVLSDGAFHDAAGHERESHADEQDLTKERKMTGEHSLSCLL